MPTDVKSPVKQMSGENQSGRAVLLDDTKHAMAHLSPLGRRLMTPIIGGLREELLAFANREKWTIIPYCRFVNWIHQFLPDGQLWFVVDKLFPLKAVPSQAVTLDVHRAYSARGADPLDASLTLEIEGPLEIIGHGTPITVLDDAAYTGSTVCSLLHMITQRGGVVKRVALCVARPKAVWECQRLGASVDCQHMAGSGQDILHLRDFFPWLPFSGRRIKRRRSAPVHSNGSPALDSRLAPTKFAHGAWLHLTGSREVLRLIDNAARLFVVAMDEHLGRSSRVADLALLGDGVALPLRSVSESVDEHTPLQKLVD